MPKFFKKIILGLFLLSAIAAFLFVSLPLPGTIPVLMYHYIGSHEDSVQQGNYVDRKSFAVQMAFLKKLRYRVISIEDYDAIKTGQRKPRGREILITFDDGSLSFEREAVPVLKQYELPVTLFLISDRVREGTEGFMPLATIKQLQAYPWLSFEGHTKTHAHLKEISDAQVKEEIIDSKKDLEEMLGKPIRYFAYPYGQFDTRSRDALKKAGYRLAFTTTHKQLEGMWSEDRYATTRIKINRVSDNPLVFWYHISGLHQMIKAARHKIKNTIGF